MIYKFISVKRVIAKVFTDLDLKEGDHRITDMIEWAGEAVKKIGGFPSLVTKITGKGGIPLIPIIDFQAKLPCDLTSINQVAYSSTSTGAFYPMVTSSGSFDATKPNEESSTTNSNLPEDSTQLVELTMSLYNESYEDALTRLNSYPSIREQLISLLNGNTSIAKNRDTTSLSDPYTYVIRPGEGYIKTNFKTGYLMVSYQAVPVDEEGFPMIPDNEAFEEAIYWYINVKLMYPEWKSGRVRDAVYYDARQSWNFYRKQAYAHAMMPNSDQLEAIKNAWVRLVPTINEHSTFFSGLSKPQIIHNQDRRR